MPFKINDVIKLTIDLPEHSLKKGAAGTVVMDFSKPQEAYLIEFVDAEGRTCAEVTMLPNQIENY